MPNLNIKNIYEWPLVTRALIIGLVCAIVFYLGYLFDITDLAKKLTSSTEKYNDVKQQIHMVIEKENIIKNEVIHLGRSKNLLNQLQNQLINYRDIPQLLNEILKLGANNQIHFSLFSPEKNSSQNNYFKMPIHIIAVGSYHQLAQFMSEIANMPWIVVIGEFTFSNDFKNDVLGAKLAEQAAVQNLLLADFKLEVYHRAESTQKK